MPAAGPKRLASVARLPGDNRERLTGEHGSSPGCVAIQGQVRSAHSPLAAALLTAGASQDGVPSGPLSLQRGTDSEAAVC
jgi:hypothetical protein